MKIIVVIMITSLMQVSAAGFAQKITFSKKGTNLEEVFKQITLQTGYNVLYAPEKINESKKIDVNFKDTELNEVLDQLIKNDPLTYVIDDKNIILKPKVPTFLERLANRWATIDVTGRIIDAEGNGIPGATVSVKGSNKSTITGKNGIFNLSNVSEDAILLISYIGYIKKEVKASGNLGDLILEQSLSKLDEVQVIAYGTTTQRLSTGNVTTVKAADIEKQPVSNPLMALQGRVPGLYVEQSAGTPGSYVKIRIQGTNSMKNGNDPLIIVDGVPFITQVSGGLGSPLHLINPSDIESIDVLKDADATSIYGSRAASGAILITTKKGKEGETKVNLNMQSGIGKVTRKLNLMSRDQYLDMKKEAFRNDGIDLNSAPFNTDLYKMFTYPDLSGWWDNSRNTDWQKELIGHSARYTEIQTSVSGGSNNSSYLFGANYHKETTVFPGDYDDTRGSIHFNISAYFSETDPLVSDQTDRLTGCRAW